MQNRNEELLQSLSSPWSLGTSTWKESSKFKSA